MVEIKLNGAAISALENAAKKVAHTTMEALQTEVSSAQVMPFNVGTMQNKNTFVNTKQETGQTTSRLITSDSPQARRLYYHPEYNFQKGNNKNAGGEWLEPWISGSEKDFVKNTYKKLYKKEANL